MAKHRRVPDVLWKLFHKRARTLAETILSLLLRPSSEPSSFLLRDGDPPDYSKLLTRCFVVVSDNAPPAPVSAPFSPARRWSQREIVTRTMEMILSEQPTSINVICSGYDKRNRSSDIAELLTCPAWCLLLERVGDALMVYLLKYTSIFLPLPREKHHQVAGSPVFNLCFKLSKHTSDSGNQHPASVLGSKKKRKRIQEIDLTSERTQMSSSFGVDLPSICVGCVGCKDKSTPTISSKLWMKKCSQKKIFDVEADSTGAETSIIDEIPSGFCRESSRQAQAKSRKRPRYFSGQRNSKRRLLSSQETCCLSHCTTNLSNSLCKLCMKNSFQNKLHEIDADSTVAETAIVEGISSGVCKESSWDALGRSRQQLSYFTEQRKSTCRSMSFQEHCFLTPCARNLSNKDSLSGRSKFNNNKSISLHNEKMPLQCSCCCVWETLHKGSGGVQIDRQSIFYKLEHSSSLLPRTHILNSLKPNSVGSTALFKDIFGTSNVTISTPSMICFHHDEHCLIGSTCLYHSLLRLLKILLHKARGPRHLRLLEKYCTVPFLDKSSDEGSVSMSEGNGHKINVKQCTGMNLEFQHHLDYQRFDPKIHECPTVQFEPSKFYCPKEKVVSFIWAVCRNIVPADMLGTSSNWRNLRRNICKFISLRRFEKFSLKQCMHKLRISEFPFLSNKHSLCRLSDHARRLDVNVQEESSEHTDGTDAVKQKLLESWIYWLFSCLVVPLLQANFHVTESEHGKQEVFYYQNSSWQKLMTTAMNSLHDQNYQLLKETSVKKILDNRTFGFSRVRLRPKENGMRPLANLSASSKMPIRQSLTMQDGWVEKRTRPFLNNIQFKKFNPVNVVLRDLHAILKDVQLKSPEKLGSSVFDYNDVYRKLRPFFLALKSGLSTVPGVYIVVADVSKAFDSVNQDKLLTVMKDIILNDSYLLKKSQQVVSTKKNLKVYQNLIVAHQDSSSRSLSAELATLVLTRSAPCIFVNQELSRTVTKERLNFDLREHVKRNVLQFDRRFYMQNVGIPQGSVLSPLLCSIYYGDLEKSIIFPFLEKSSEYGERDSGDASALLNCRENELVFSSPEYILLRLVDDFLFISTSRKQAASFFTRLRRGFREYNCYMNEQKFGLNFDIDQKPWFQSNRIYVGADGNSFLRWTGLFINCKTLEVQADYTRYLDSHLSSTLTVCWQGRPIRRLKEKLCGYLRPKCHPIFYDSNINSAAVVRLNIYQAFLICAMKFHCYIRDLSHICTLDPKSYMSIILGSLRYMNKLIKKRMHSMIVDRNFRPVLQVAKEEIVWLGVKAYIRILERKHSRYKQLIFFLKHELKAYNAENASSVLKEAIDDLHSSLIWKIKF